MTLPSTIEMQSCEFTHHEGQWLAPLCVVEELYSTLRQQQGRDDYITLASDGSDIRIRCTLNQSKLLTPLALPEAQKRWGSDKGTATEPVVHDLTGEDSVATSPAPDRSGQPVFAATEREAVQRLRDRGYLLTRPLTTPYPEAWGPVDVSPPPAYDLIHQSSSRSAPGTAKVLPSLVMGSKRKRRSPWQPPSVERCAPSPPQRDHSIVPARFPDPGIVQEIADSDADTDEDDSLPWPKRPKTQAVAKHGAGAGAVLTPPPNDETSSQTGSLDATVEVETATAALSRRLRPRLPRVRKAEPVETAQSPSRARKRKSGKKALRSDTTSKCAKKRAGSDLTTALDQPAPIMSSPAATSSGATTPLDDST